jgi:hypothetical protein
LTTIKLPFSGKAADSEFSDVSTTKEAGGAEAEKRDGSFLREMRWSDALRVLVRKASTSLGISWWLAPLRERRYTQTRGDLFYLISSK